MRLSRNCWLIGGVFHCCLRKYLLYFFSFRQDSCLVTHVSRKHTHTHPHTPTHTHFRHFIGKCERLLSTIFHYWFHSCFKSQNKSFTLQWPDPNLSSPSFPSCLSSPLPRAKPIPLAAQPPPIHPSQTVRTPCYPQHTHTHMLAHSAPIPSTSNKRNCQLSTFIEWTKGVLWEKHFERK